MMNCSDPTSLVGLVFVSIAIFLPTAVIALVTVLA